MLNSKIAIVTGSRGFIGKSLVGKLQSLSWQTIGVEINPDKTSIDVEPIIDRINQGDFNPETTVFLHVGANANAGAVKLSQLYYENVELTEKFFDAASSKQIPTVFVSSAAIYGNKDINSTLSPYAESKILGERQLKSLQQSRDWSAMIFRLFNTYGSGENSKGTMASIPRQFINSAMNNKKIEIWDVPGGHIQSRDFIFIDDVTTIICDAVTSGAIHDGGTFDLGTATSVDFNEVAQIVRKYIPANIARTPFPPTQNLAFYQLHTKALNQYQMRVNNEFRCTPLEEGMQRYVARILAGDES